MDTRSIVAVTAIGCIIVYVVTIIIYMKLSGGQFLTKLKALFKLDTQQLTRAFIFKKYTFLGVVVLLNIAFVAFVYFVTSYRIVMYLVLFLKSKDIITTTIWLISLFVRNMRRCVRGKDTEPIKNKTIVSVIPAYSETYEQIIRTLDSIVYNEIGDNRNLLFIICDGKENNIQRALDQCIKTDQVQYKTWKLVDNQLTMIYGFYKGTPCVVLKKKLNQGKKDSLILSHDFFNYPRDTCGSIEVRNHVRTEVLNLFGLKDFDYMFCTDADSIITKGSFSYMLETLERRNAHACCGLVVVDFAESDWSPWNLYQNFQYLYGQYVRRGCEDLIGSVTCMPGCITMFRICPLAANAIKLYSTLPGKNDFIKNSVQMLGTDRRLAASFLYQSSEVKHVLDCRAKCYTIPPNTLYQYISQRRRWGSNMYFNSLCNMIGPNINWFIRFLCFLDVTRVSLAYFRIFNIILFIYSITKNFSTDFKLYLPFIFIVMYPIMSFFIYCLFDPFLRKMYFKVILGYILNKCCSLCIMVMIISNMFWNVGSTAWGGVQHKPSNSTVLELNMNTHDVVIEIPPQMGENVPKQSNVETDHPAQDVIIQIDPDTDGISMYDESLQDPPILDPPSNPLPDSPKSLHDSPKSLHDSPKSLHDSPKSMHDSPKSMHDQPIDNELLPAIMNEIQSLQSIMSRYDNPSQIDRHAPVPYDGPSYHSYDSHSPYIVESHQPYPFGPTSELPIVTVVRQPRRPDIQPTTLKTVPVDDRSKKLCKMAVRYDGYSLTDVPHQLIDERICRIAFKHNGQLKHIPSDLRSHPICWIAVKYVNDSLKDVPVEMRSRQLCKRSVKYNGITLKDVPEMLRTKKMCIKAIENEGNAYFVVPTRLKHNPKLIRIAVEKNGCALYDVPEECKTRELCELAVKNNGIALYAVPEQWRTPELVTIALQQDGVHRLNMQAL
jgi:chitin synthase